MCVLSIGSVNLCHENENSCLGTFFVFEVINCDTAKCFKITFSLLIGSIVFLLLDLTIRNLEFIVKCIAEHVSF